MKLKAPNHSNINHGSNRVAPGEIIEVADTDVESLKALGWLEVLPPKKKPIAKTTIEKDGES